MIAFQLKLLYSMKIGYPKIELLIYRFILGDFFIEVDSKIGSKDTFGNWKFTKLELVL